MEENPAPSRPHGPHRQECDLLHLEPDDVFVLLSRQVPHPKLRQALVDHLRLARTTRQLYTSLWCFVQAEVLTHRQACSDAMCNFYLYYCPLRRKYKVHTLSVILRRMFSESQS